jgi:plastocyanin
MQARIDPRRTAIGAAAIAILAIALLAGGAALAANRAQALPRKGATTRVNIRDFAFHPRTLTVNRGTKVVFANSDSTAHTATSDGNFATGRIRPSRSAAVEFEQRGSFAYHCSIHNFMHGKIVVR